MDGKTFLDNFGTIAEAPGGGVDRLRELILVLAVHGQLVPQLPTDRPVSSEQLVAGREGLIAMRQINKPRHPEGRAVKAPPYSIPRTWYWYHLGDVGAVVGGGTPSSQESRFWADGNAVPWITPADMRGQASRYVTRGERDITEEGLASSSTQLLPARSVLFSSRAPIGHVGIAQTPLATNQGFKSCVPYLPDMSEYLYVFLKKIGPEVSDAATGTTFKEVSGKQVALIPVPVPPLAEQERIVAKVDELMQLCDVLEARQQARQHVTTRLRASSLDTLTNAKTDDDIHAAWSRIHANWEGLTDHPDSIDNVRQAILQLAVRGTLVDQRSAEGSAEELLSDITAERERLLALGLMKKPRTLTEVQPPYALPPTWRWVRLGSLLTDLSYGTAKKCRPAPAAGFPVLRIPNITIETGGIDFGDLKYTELSGPELTKWAVATGDLLLIRSNGSARLVGRSVVVPEAAAGMAFAGYLMRAKLCGVDSHFIRIALETPGTRAQIEGPIRTTSGVKNVNSTEITSLQIPLPPLAEQRRIVERVNQLDQRCGDLGDALLQRTEASRRLAAAIAQVRQRQPT